MTLTIELPDTDEAAWNAEAAKLGLTPDEMLRQAAAEKMEALIASLKNRRIPQTLDDIKPKRVPPPGKTAMQMVYQQLPADESDEEIRRVLEELS